MKNLAFVLIMFTNLYSNAQQKMDMPALIPQPVSVVKKAGVFTLPKTVIIQVLEKQDDAENVAQMLRNKINTATGYPVQIKKVTTFTSNTIRFILNASDTKALGKEGYLLNVTAKDVTVTAGNAAGLFYGMQTLLQLFPPEIESRKQITKSSWILPQVQITDSPRFAWRGLMLDVARHFFNKDEIRHFIDDMAKYKFNILHLHLTDDEGWRIEIKSLPKLTEIGAWRPERIGTFTFFTHPKPEDPSTYGGFLTQEDIKEIVAYAGKHYINVMPEIDVPGHSLAAIAAYGNLASVPGNYRPCSGDTVMVWPKDGDFYALYDNSLCAGKPEVYDFLDKVFTEIAALFPFEYIHVGGDENAKNFWEKSEEIKELMKRENIPNIHLVQEYFTHRVEEIIKSKGKKMIGWDEISEGKLDPNTAIMGWRESRGGIDASDKQHEVVFASTKYAYFNYMQGDPAIEPPVHSTRLLKTTYETEPLPEGMDPQYLKGIQACLWTEQVYNYRHLQYMLWPRTFAMAELAWTPANRKNWPEFINRVEKHFTRYNYSETKYSPALYDPLLNVEMGKDNILKLAMETQIPGLKLYYSFDNSFPDNYYPEYTGVINVPKDASMLRVISYRDGKPIGRMISAPIAELKKRL